MSDASSEKPKAVIRRFALTLVLAVAALFVSLQRGGGIWLILVLLLVIVWGLYTVVRMMLNTVGRSDRAIRLAIWGVVLLIGIVTQMHWETSARDAADKVAARLADYKLEKGMFPDSLSVLGFNERQLSQDWELRYLLREGKPELSYAASMMPLSTYEYDFSTNQWSLNAY